MKAIALLVAVVGTTTAATQTTYRPEDRLSRAEHFNGELRLLSEGGPFNLRVDAAKWTLGGGLSVDQLDVPRGEVTIVQLRSGEVTTVINGERQEREEDELWTVAYDETMELATEDDSAIVQTIVLDRDDRAEGSLRSSPGRVGERSRTYQQQSPGLLSRSVYRVDAPGVYTVHVRDLLVGPGLTADGITFPGAVLLYVQSGSGTATIDSQDQELEPSASITVDEGAVLRLQNRRQNLGLSLRAVVVTAPSP